MSPAGAFALIQMATDALCLVAVAVLWQKGRAWRAEANQAQDAKWDVVRQQMNSLEAKGAAATVEEHLEVEAAVRARLKESHGQILCGNPYRSYIAWVVVGYLTLNVVLIALSWRDFVR